MVAPLARSGMLCVLSKSVLPSAFLVSSAIAESAFGAINMGRIWGVILNQASTQAVLPALQLECQCLTYAVLCSTSLIFLDAYQGPLQWQTSYNLVALRHISFAVDKHWSSNQLAVREPARAPLDTLKVRCIHTEGSYYSYCLSCQRQRCCESTCMHAGTCKVDVHSACGMLRVHCCVHVLENAAAN